MQVKASPLAKKSSLSHRLTMLGTIATSLSVFGLFAVQGIILSRLLGPTGRGEYATVVLFTQTFMQIGLFGSVYVLARRAARDSSNVDALQHASAGYSLLTGTATAAVVCVMAMVGLPAEKQHLVPLCCACACQLPMEHLRLMLLSIDHGLGAFTRYNVVKFISAAALPLLLTVAWLLGRNSLGWFVVLTIAAPAASLLVAVAATRPRLSRPPTTVSVATLAREGWPYWISVLSRDLFRRTDQMMLLWLATFAAQGLYAAATPPTTLLLMAPEAMALFTFNAGAKGRGRSLRKLSTAAFTVLGIQVASALALASVLEPLMLFVYGQSFAAAVPLAFLHLPACVLTGCTTVAEGYLHGRKKIAVTVWSRLLGLAAVVTTTLLLWSTWGVAAAPIAFSVGSGIVSACMVWAVIRDVGENTPQLPYRVGRQACPPPIPAA